MLAYLNEKIYLDRRVHCCFICVLSQQMASPGPSVTSGRTRASSVGILFALPCPCLSEQPAFPEPWHVNNGLDLTATHLETPFPAPRSPHITAAFSWLIWPDWPFPEYYRDKVLCCNEAPSGRISFISDHHRWCQTLVPETPGEIGLSQGSRDKGLTMMKGERNLKGWGTNKDR